MIRYDLPWTNPPLSGNRVRGNPHAQGAKTAQALEDARYAIRMQGPHAWPAGAPAVVTLHFRPTTWHRRDADNLGPTFKAAQDALVKEGVLFRDDFKYVRRAAQEIHEPNGEPAALWITVEIWTP